MKCAQLISVRRRLLVPAMIALASLGLALFDGARALAILADWQGGNGNWNANNWGLSGDHPNNGQPNPGDTYDVLIDAAGTYQVTMNINPTIDSLTINSADATLYANARTLTVVNAIDVTSGKFNWHGTSTVNAKSLTNHGTITINPASGAQTFVTMNVTNAISNHGLFEIQAGFGWNGQLTVGGAAQFINEASGTLHFDQTPEGGGTTFSLLNSNLTNSGTVLVTRGSTFTKSGGVYINNGAGSSWTLNQGINITGPNASFTMNDGQMNLNANFAFTSAATASEFELNGGTINTSASGNLQLLGAGSQFVQNGGTLAGGGIVQVNAGGTGKIELNDGSLAGGTTFRLQGVDANSAPPAAELAIASDYNAGNFDASITALGKVAITGTLPTIQAGRTLQVGDTSIGIRSSVTTPGALVNHGTITLTGQTFGWHQELNIPGTLTNSATGLVQLLDPSRVTTGANRWLNTTLNNQGTFRVDSKVSLGRLGSTGSETHTNSGLFDVEAGAVFTMLGASYTQTGGTTRVNGSLNFTTKQMLLGGGTLEGSGTLTAQVVGTVAGTGLTVSPGQSTGTLTVNGHMFLDGNDTLAIELGGMNQGAAINGYDFLNVSGTVDLGGATLQLDLLNNLFPSETDVFTILDAGVLIGEFGNYSEGWNSFGKFGFLLSFDNNMVVLSNFMVIPEPASGALLLMGLVTLRGRRRRLSRG